MEHPEILTWIPTPMKCLNCRSKISSHQGRKSQQINNAYFRYQNVSGYRGIPRPPKLTPVGKTQNTQPGGTDVGMQPGGTDVGKGGKRKLTKTVSGAMVFRSVLYRRTMHICLLFLCKCIACSIFQPVADGKGKKSKPIVAVPEGAMAVEDLLARQNGDGGSETISAPVAKPPFAPEHHEWVDYKSKVENLRHASSSASQEVTKCSAEIKQLRNQFEKLESSGKQHYEELKNSMGSSIGKLSSFIESLNKKLDSFMNMV